MGLWADLGFLAKIATGLGMAGKWASLKIYIVIKLF
jgi:hypothetical protein